MLFVYFIYCFKKHTVIDIKLLIQHFKTIKND